MNSGAKRKILVPNKIQLQRRNRFVAKSLSFLWRKISSLKVLMRTLLVTKIISSLIVVNSDELEFLTKALILIWPSVLLFIFCFTSLFRSLSPSQPIRNIPKPLTTSKRSQHRTGSRRSRRRDYPFVSISPSRLAIRDDLAVAVAVAVVMIPIRDDLAVAVATIPIHDDLAVATISIRDDLAVATISIRDDLAVATIPIRDDLSESFAVTAKSFAVLVAFACRRRICSPSSLKLAVVAEACRRRWSSPSSLQLPFADSAPATLRLPLQPVTLRLPFKNFFFPKIIFIYCFSTVCNTSHTHIQECIYFFDCVYLSKLLFLQKGKVGLCCVCLWASVRWCVELWWWQSFHEEECVLVWRWGVLLMFERRSGGWLWYIFFGC